jgi:flagellar capping protein FliD
LPAGSPTTLSQLGITMDSSLNMSVSDTGKFQAALNNNPAGVKALLQAVADRLDTRLDRYTDPTRGTLTLSQNSLTDQLKNVDNRIADMNQYLKQYQASLQTQYAGLQSQILSNFDTQSQLSAMSGYSATG